MGNGPQVEATLGKVGKTVEEKSLWEFASGLPLDGADVEITNAVFEVDNSYMAGATVLAVTFTPIAGGDSQRQLYSCGQRFEPIDGGAALGHESGKNVMPHKNTNYGKFGEAAARSENADKFLAFATDGPLSTTSWIGTKWTLGSLATENFQTKKAGSLIIPVVYLGGPDGQTSGGGAKASKASSGSVSTDIDPDVLAAIIAVAAKHEEFGDFMDEALELEGVQGNKAAEKLVMDSKPGGLFGKNHK